MKRLAAFCSASLMLALGMLLVCAPGAAHAQARPESAPEFSQDWSIRLGLYIFQSQTARGKAGEVGFSGIVERNVYRGETYDILVGAGYDGIGDVYAVPITVTAIGHHFNLRYGLGVGYAFGKRVTGRGMAGSVISPLIGYQLTTKETRYPLSLDLRYNFISGASSELDGYSLTLGAQF